MYGKRHRLTEEDLNRIVKKVISEQSPSDKPYFFFTSPEKRVALKPGPSKFRNIIPKSYYMVINFEPKPGGGQILYDCSGTLKVGKGNYGGYDTVKTVVYNDTLVSKLDKSKWCKGGTYNSGSLTQNDDQTGTDMV